MTYWLALLIYLGIIVSEAFWDAEAFKEGKSNHTAKIFEKSLWLLFAVVLYYGFDCYSWVQLTLVLLAYPLLRFSLFDYIINFIRGVRDPFNYKLFGKPWQKTLALILVVGLFVVYILL